jgi:hypothetical protein
MSRLVWPLAIVTDPVVRRCVPMVRVVKLLPRRALLSPPFLNHLFNAAMPVKPVSKQTAKITRKVCIGLPSLR